MRAYVITGTEATADDITNVKEIVGVTSSRKTAIDSCEEYLGRTGEQDVIKWDKKDKHTGHATLGDHVASYQMFFVNQVEIN